MKKKLHLITLFVSIISAVFIIATISVPLVTAFYIKTVTLQNEFNPAPSKDPQIVASSSADNIIENVSISIPKDSIEYPVYVRVAIVVTWQEKDGTTHYKQPKLNEDYELVLDGNASKNWIIPSGNYNENSNGFYYYNTPLSAGMQTSVLIKSLKQKASAVAPGNGEYSLVVNIIVQTVQAIGSTDADDKVKAVEDAWKVKLQ